MAKTGMLQRFLLIIGKLEGQNGYIPGDVLIKHVEKEMRYRDGNLSGSSLRTIQRDIKSIEELFGIVIKHKKGYGYYIADKEIASAERYEELLLNFDILSALNADSGLKRYIQAEHHRPVGSNNLPVLIEAIRNNRHVDFDYTLFRHDNAILHKTVSPYFLKESRERWYLVALDGDKLKLFGVERISNLQILADTFERDETIDIDNLFKDCFGIWNQEDIPVEDIVLSYSALDGRFLKSVPLHHSQTILTDTESEFRISVRLRITNDFVMELLSRSTSLTVIKPVSLRRRVAEIYEKALQRNMDK